MSLNDAYVLRQAVQVLHRRGPTPMPFSLRVIIRVLERTADRIEVLDRDRPAVNS